DYETDDGKIEEHAVTGASTRQRLAAERSRDCEHLRPVMLQTARVQMRDIVVTRMVPLDSVGKREVERRKVEDGDLREVGVVRQRAIDRREDRPSCRIAGGAQRSSDVEVAGARLEHERTAACATCLEIEDGGDVLRPRMLAHKCGGSEESGFFTVGEEGYDIVCQRPVTCTQRAERFENRGGSGTVVGRRRARLDTVVVRHDEDRFAIRATARKSGENVLNASR